MQYNYSNQIPINLMFVVEYQPLRTCFIIIIIDFLLFFLQINFIDKIWVILQFFLEGGVPFFDYT